MSVECCDVCGSGSWGFLIVSCGICRGSREHLYCMQKNLMEEPQIWWCADCKEEMPKLRRSLRDRKLNKKFFNTWMVANLNGTWVTDWS